MENEERQLRLYLTVCRMGQETAWQADYFSHGLATVHNQNCV